MYSQRERSEKNTLGIQVRIISPKVKGSLFYFLPGTLSTELGGLRGEERKLQKLSPLGTPKGPNILWQPLPYFRKKGQDRRMKCISAKKTLFLFEGKSQLTERESDKLPQRPPSA